MNFKLIAFATNDNGEKIYCRLAYGKKTMVKGYYDFTKDKFFITKYVKSNFQQGIGKNTVREKLIELLKIDYDWELQNNTTV